VKGLLFERPHVRSMSPDLHLHVRARNCPKNLLRNGRASGCAPRPLRLRPGMKCVWTEAVARSARIPCELGAAAVRGAWTGVCRQVFVAAGGARAAWGDRSDFRDEPVRAIRCLSPGTPPVTFERV